MEIAALCLGAAGLLCAVAALLVHRRNLRLYKRLYDLEERMKR